ncbi:MAG TPA: magnesium-translocating P-type ATPase [Candidatus Saccharimonadales bacterium]|nr:magnesium-translocating P-type ATPase [Candidatus Saccharimonadales bacterium]
MLKDWPELDQISLLGTKQAFQALGSGMKGLKDEEVDLRRKRFGANQLVLEKKHQALRDLLSKFLSPVILILIVAGSLSLFFHDSRSAIVIYVMVFLSVFLDFIQEYKSAKAAEKLQEKVIVKIEVWRDGQKKSLKSAELVPGDLVFLSVGSIIPADCRLIEEHSLFTNESSLTGESFPVAKTATASKNKENVLLAGTNIVSGYGLALVVRTGAKTDFGQIAANLSTTEGPTEFEKGIRSFSVMVSQTILILVIVIFFLNTLFKGFDWYNSLLFSLALAVGLTPELLPMIVSITLAKGSLNMSKHGVIVKRLNAIHSFGAMNILCTDKTGTLTENKIKLVKNVDIFGTESKVVLNQAYLNSFFQSGLVNPLDEAVLKIKIDLVSNIYYKIGEIPFDFSRRRLAVILQPKEDATKFFIISKGAPESLFGLCNKYRQDGKLKEFSAVAKAQALNEYQALSRDGFRVLAIAYKEISVGKEEVRKEKKDILAHADDYEQDMVLSGFIAFFDPPKKAVAKAIKDLNRQGVEVKIISGDNDLVIRKICQEVELPSKGYMSGEEVEKLSPEELVLKVNEISVFYRTSPQQKEKIIRAIRANDNVVGYLGDGINDALPLKAADVGISVNNGVDVAKEAADLILLTHDLSVLSLGVDSGRKTFANTLKYILMGLSSNFGNMFSVAAASFLLPFLPMTPLQLLLNNFLYDFSQTTIPSDNVDAEMIAKPRRWNTKNIRNLMIFLGPISSIFDILTFVILFFVFKLNEGQFQTGWFLESLATQILVIFVIRTKKIPFLQSRPSRLLLFSILLVLAIGWLLPFMPFAAYFGFVAPNYKVMLSIVVLVGAYLIFTQKIKGYIFKKFLDY